MKFISKAYFHLNRISTICFLLLGLLKLINNEWVKLTWFQVCLFILIPIVIIVIRMAVEIYKSWNNENVERY